GLLLASGDAAPDGQDVLALEAARLRVGGHDARLRREGVLRLRLGLLLLLLLGLVVGGDEGPLALGADAHVDARSAVLGGHPRRLQALAGGLVAQRLGPLARR